MINENDNKSVEVIMDYDTSQTINISDYSKEQLKFMAKLLMGPIARQFDGYLSEMDKEAIFAGALGLEPEFEAYYDL